MNLDLLFTLFWLLLAGWQLRSAWLGATILPLLLAVESFLIGYRLVARHPERAHAAVPSRQRVVAWLSLFLPLALRGGEQTLPGQALAVAGLLLTLWALVTLGRSFGVAPADRGLVVHGPYRWIRHPMYAGALLNALGFLLANPSPWNGLVFGVLLVSAGLRIRWEERLIAGYAGYTQSVSYRLVPGVW